MRFLHPIRRRLAGAALFALCLAALPARAAGDEAAGAGGEGLRYNEAQFKAAHNSIDRAETLAEQLRWDPEKPHEGGCRGVELDIVQDPARVGPGDAWVFAVQHGGTFRADAPRLEKCLKEIRAWADASPRHDVVTLHIDLKPEATLGDDRVFVEKIDALLAASLGRESFFTPAMLQRGEPSVLEGARKHGWPLLRELRGKFIVVFSGGDGDLPVGRRRKAYLTTEPGRRLAFVDLDQRAAGATRAAGGGPPPDECSIANPYYNEGSRVFVNIQLGRGDWTRLAREAHGSGFVTREWKANGEEAWARARECGVNVLSTDVIRGAAWASVGREPFARIELKK